MIAQVQLRVCFNHAFGNYLGVSLASVRPPPLFERCPWSTGPTQSRTRAAIREDMQERKLFRELHFAHAVRTAPVLGAALAQIGKE